MSPPEAALRADDPDPPMPPSADANELTEADVGVFATAHDRCITLCGGTPGSGNPTLTVTPGLITLDGQEGSNSIECEEYERVNVTAGTNTIECSHGVAIATGGAGINVSGGTVTVTDTTHDNSGEFTEFPTLRHAGSGTGTYVTSVFKEGQGIAFTGNATFRNSLLMEHCYCTKSGQCPGRSESDPNSHNDLIIIQAGGLDVEGTTFKKNWSANCDDHGTQTQTASILAQVSSGDGGTIRFVNNYFTEYSQNGINIDMDAGGGTPFSPVTITGNIWDSDFFPNADPVSNAFRLTGSDCAGVTFTWSGNVYSSGVSIGSNPCP